ncbi:molecular chaperone TorD family protein [Gordonibacter sp. RACS_AR49]|uniref:molecular chaperone TorD family protein n=1 Tax=Gordonibacter sp. RACS_AR49 TaxID=2871986 RepID=UPI002613C4C2|nr:molecular chaperone TorD family protein [Gordonibacter sp. RACS_AR49]MDN4508777.1 molecular chaperone TorD family protein [Gordonibacter sp. RACS_AR49]
MEDARKAAAWYGYGAHVLLDPIEVPGTAYVVDLAKRTRMLLEWTEAERAGAAGTVSATVAADTAEAMGAVGVTAAAEATGTACAAGAADTTGAADAAGRSGLTAWCKRVEDLVARGVEGADALAEEQRAVAADRTRLCRGISQDAPLPPPYEAYYREGAVEGDVSASYRRVGVRFDGTAERDDYLGVELAFLDCLARAEEAAHARGDGPAAAAYAQQRQSFEQEHLPWVAAFCTAALPHARTAYGRAALEALAARSARGNQPECFM